MGGANREGKQDLLHVFPAIVADLAKTGGKAKPLKAAKKQAKDLDDDDKAFQEKKRAGTSLPDHLPTSLPTVYK